MNSQSRSAEQGFLFRLRWKPLALAGAVAACIYTPIIVSGNSGTAITYWLGLFITSLVLVFAAAILTFIKSRNKALTLVGIAAVCVLVSCLLSQYDYALRTSYRWTFHSRMYKEQLLAQHGAAPGGLTYMDWDGWGFIGGETEVYLVHDPTDHLKRTSRGGYGVIAEGLPCEVWKIRRLEQEWYSIVFFTDEDWNDCSPSHAGSH